MNPILAFFVAVGAFAIGLFATVGRVTIFAWRTIVRALAPPYYPIRLLEQLLLIGWFSLPVVGLTAVFTGAALAQQIYVRSEERTSELQSLMRISYAVFCLKKKTKSTKIKKNREVTK